MKNALIAKLALVLLLTLTFLTTSLAAQTSFPQRPDTHEVINFMPAQCSAENIIFVIFYGVGSGSQETARTEFYLADETLFAVILFKGEATNFFILQLDKSISHYKTIEELNGQTPCDTANKLYENRR